VTTLLVERTGRPGPAVEPSGGSTLERLVSGVWHDLARRASAACPVCGGEMSQSASGAPAGTCTTCGSELT
jgi:hypothetical protein